MEKKSVRYFEECCYCLALIEYQDQSHNCPDITASKEAKDIPTDLTGIISNLNNSIKIKLEGHPIIAGVDSGCVQSLMSHSVYNNLPKKVKLGRNDHKYRAFGGEELVNIGAARFNVEINKVQIKHVFTVFPDKYKTGVVLGIDFLRQHDIKLDFSTYEFQVKDTTVPLIPDAAFGEMKIIENSSEWI